MRRSLIVVLAALALFGAAAATAAWRGSATLTGGGDAIAQPENPTTTTELDAPTTTGTA
jgi:hypothetical protein